MRLAGVCVAGRAAVTERTAETGRVPVAVIVVLTVLIGAGTVRGCEAADCARPGLRNLRRNQ